MMKNFKKVLCCLILLITMFATCNKVFAFQVGDKYHKNHSTTVGTYNNVVVKVDGNKYVGNVGTTLYRHTGYQVDNNQNKISGDYNFYCLDPTRQAHNVGDNNKANYTVKSILSKNNRKDLAILYIATKEGYSYDAKSLAIRALSPATIYYEGPISGSSVEFQKAFYNSSAWWLQHKDLQIVDDGALLNRFFGVSSTFKNCYKSNKNGDASCIQSNVKNIRSLISRSQLSGYSSYSINDGSLSGTQKSDLAANALKLYVEAVKYADGYVNSTSKQRTVTLSDFTGDKNKVIDYGCEPTDNAAVSIEKQFNVNVKNFKSTKIADDALTIRVNATGDKNFRVTTTEVKYSTDNGKTWKDANKNGDTKFIDLIKTDNDTIRFKVKVLGWTTNSGEASFNIGATVYYRGYRQTEDISGAYLVSNQSPETYQRFIIATGKPNEIGDFEVPNIAPINVTFKTECRKVCADYANKQPWTDQIDRAYNLCKTTESEKCETLVGLLNLKNVGEAKSVRPDKNKQFVICEELKCAEKVKKDGNGKYISYSDNNKQKSLTQCLIERANLSDSESASCFQDTTKTKARLTCNLNTCQNNEGKTADSQLRSAVNKKDYAQIDYLLLLNPVSNHAQAKLVGIDKAGKITCGKTVIPQACKDVVGSSSYKQYSSLKDCNNVYDGLTDKENENVVCISSALNYTTTAPARLYCSLKTCSQIEKQGVKYSKIEKYVKEKNYAQIKYELGLESEEEAEMMIKASNGNIACKKPEPATCEQKYGEKGAIYTGITVGVRKTAMEVCNSQKNSVSDPQNVTCLEDSTGEYAKLVCNLKRCENIEGKAYEAPSRLSTNIFKDLTFTYGLNPEDNYKEARAIKSVKKGNKDVVTCEYKLYKCEDLKNQKTKYNNETKQAVAACKSYKTTAEKTICNAYVKKYSITNRSEVIKIWNNNGYVDCNSVCTDHTKDAYTDEINTLVQNKNYKGLSTLLNLKTDNGYAEAKKVRRGSDGLIVCTACSEVEGKYNTNQECESAKSSLPGNIPDGPAVCVNAVLYCGGKPTVCEDHIGEAYTSELNNYVQLQTQDGWKGITKLLNLVIDNNYAEAKKVNESPNHTIICEKPVCSTRLAQIKASGKYKEYATEQGIVKFNSEITINEQNPAGKLIDGEIVCEPLTCEARLAQIKNNGKWDTREYMGTLGFAKFKSEITDVERAILLEDEHVACGNVCSPENMPDKNNTEEYRRWMSECCYPTEKHFNVYDQCSVQQECMKNATTEEAKKACLKDGKDWCSIYDNACICKAKSDIGNSCVEPSATDQEVELGKDVKEGSIIESTNINLCVVGNRAHELKKHDTQNANDKYVPYDVNSNTGNKYCKVYCKEDYSFNIPKARYTINGQYFTLGMRVESTKSCYTTNVDYSMFNDDYSKALAKAEQLYNAGDNSSNQFKAAVKELNTIIDDINACGGDWYSDYKANPEISFTYEEEEYIKQLPDDKLKLIPAVDPATNKETSVISATTYRCSGQVDDNYNCSNGWKEVTVVDQASNRKNLDKSYAGFKLTSDGKYERTNDIPAPQGDIRYTKKVITKTLDLVPESVFYTEYSTGVIKVGADGLTSKYSVLQSKLFNDLRNKYGEEKVPYATAVPVELKTGKGIYNYNFNFDALGENLTTGEVGRIITKDGKTTIDKLNSKFQGNYMCKYIVNCPNCKVKCVEDPARGIFCDFEEKCTGENCPLVCAEYGCAFDNVHGLLFTVRNFDNTNVNIEGVTPGLNLDPSVSQKAEAFLEEVQESGDDITKEPEYSFEITPAVISKLRSEGGNYNDTKNMKCINYSEKIKELAAKYPERYTAEDVKNAEKYDYQICESTLLEELSKDGKIHTSLDGRNKVMSFFESAYCKDENHTCILVGALPQEGVTRQAPQGPAYK